MADRQSELNTASTSGATPEQIRDDIRRTRANMDETVDAIKSFIDALTLFAGDAALMYVMWYGAVRTLLETYRVNNWTILGVPTAMWVGIIGFVLAGAWLIYRHRRGWGSPMIRPADEPDAEARPAPQPHPEASAG